MVAVTPLLQIALPVKYRYFCFNRCLLVKCSGLVECSSFAAGVEPVKSQGSFPFVRHMDQQLCDKSIAVEVVVFLSLCLVAFVFQNNLILCFTELAVVDWTTFNITCQIVDNSFPVFVRIHDFNVPVLATQLVDQIPVLSWTHGLGPANIILLRFKSCTKFAPEQPHNDPVG